MTWQRLALIGYVDVTERGHLPVVAQFADCHVSDRSKHTLGWRECRLLEELLAVEMGECRYRGRVLGFYNLVEKHIVYLIKPVIKALRSLYRLPSKRW